MTETKAGTIWHRPFDVKALNEMPGESMVTHLDIIFTEVGPDYLKADMPVDGRTMQPFGILHGGASAALAETVGSVGANACVDRETKHCVGLEVNANHLRAVREGKVTATGRPLHIGRSTQVWEIRIEDDAERLICVSRLTLAVVDKKQ